MFHNVDGNRQIETIVMLNLSEIFDGERCVCQAGALEETCAIIDLLFLDVDSIDG